MNNFNRSQHAWMDFNNFWRGMITGKNNIDLELELEVSTKDTARFFITHNQQIVYDQNLSAGPHQIQMQLVCDQSNQLRMGMSGKDSVKDTVVLDGQIVQDKFIRLTKFNIDNFDLLRDYDFFYNKLQYFNHDQNQYTSVSDGFWFNSELVIDYYSPFILWYTDKTNKNTQISPSLMHRFSDLNEYSAIEQRLSDQLKGIKR